jgi:hypothetical protein
VPPTSVGDDVLDSAALVEALLHTDPEATETVLKHGDNAGMCLVLAGWLAAALAHIGPQEATAKVAGWRAMGQDRTDGGGDGWRGDYRLP